MNTVQIKRFRFDAEIPTVGLIPGELIVSLDKKKLYVCLTSTERLCINSDIALYDHWDFSADTITGIINVPISSMEKVHFKPGIGIELIRTSHAEYGNQLEIRSTSLPDKTFRHIQTEPGVEWVINHNFGKIPAVTVTDSAGTEVECEVIHIDTNTLILNFSEPFAGCADLN